MKIFEKKMDWEGSGSAFLQETFPQISMEKLKAGIFDGLQIRELMEDPVFDEELSEAELSAWLPQKSVVKNFQGFHTPIESLEEWNWRVSTNSGHECQSNWTFCSYTWTIFQRTVEI